MDQIMAFNIHFFPADSVFMHNVLESVVHLAPNVGRFHLECYLLIFCHSVVYLFWNGIKQFNCALKKATDLCTYDVVLNVVDPLVQLGDVHLTVLCTGISDL